MARYGLIKDVTTKGNDFKQYSGIWVDQAQGEKTILRCWEILGFSFVHLGFTCTLFQLSLWLSVVWVPNVLCGCNLTIPHLRPSLYASLFWGWDLLVTTTVRLSLMPTCVQPVSLKNWVNVWTFVYWKIGYVGYIHPPCFHPWLGLSLYNFLKKFNGIKQTVSLTWGQLNKMSLNSLPWFTINVPSYYL